MTDPAPVVDLPFDEALKELTGFEVIAIQKHYGTDLEKMGGIRSMCGTVWAYENRRAKVSWATVEGMTLREINDYFAEREPDPDSDQGKDLAC